MWIMGVSIVISFRSLRQREVRPMRIFLKIIRRTLILFGLGLLVSNCKSATPFISACVLVMFHHSCVMGFAPLLNQSSSWAIDLFGLYVVVFFRWRSPLSGEFAPLSFHKLYVHIHENNPKFEWNSFLVKLVRVRHRYRRGAELDKQTIFPCDELNKYKLKIYGIMYI